jgi:hypothetical protein
MLAVLAVGLLLFVLGCAAPRTTTEFISAGETVVAVNVTQRGNHMPTMINLHDDENTSVAAGKFVVAKTGGRLVELVHSGDRHLTFALEGKSFRFDPNRMFSDTGIQATLSRQGDYSEAAHQAVKNFAANFIERYALDCEPVIIALHNTSGGGLTIQSYLPEGRLQAVTAQVHVSSQRQPGDFFYVTEPGMFDYLRELDFNVVLQDNQNVPDDGSASVYFARKGIPYLNVEAQVGRLEEQIEMLRVVVLMLAEFNLLGLP